MDISRSQNAADRRIRVQCMSHYLFLQHKNVEGIVLQILEKGDFLFHMPPINESAAIVM